MEHLKSRIISDLKELTKEEREEFRNLILKSYEEIIAGVSDRIDNFEKKIIKSVGRNNVIINVAVSMIPKSDYYIYEEKFFPMLKSDENYIRDLTLKEVLTSNEKIYKDIYLKKIDNVEEIEGKKIKGIVKVEDKEFSIEFILEKNNRYEEKIEELYKVFSLNKLRWKTILNPYIKNIYTLKVDKYDENMIDYLDGKESVEIYKENLKDIWVEDMIMCWNIDEQLVIGDSGLVQPTKDRIHQQHTLSFISNKNIYVAPSDEYNIYNIEKMGSDRIIVITDENKKIIWKLIEIMDIDDEFILNSNLTIFDNKMNVNFMNELAINKERRIRTVVELERILISFRKFNEYFEFLDIQMGGDIDNIIETRDLNSFILDEFKLKGRAEKLYIKLKLKKDDEFTDEVLNFIISEIQLYFPEYICKGVIIK